MWSILIVVSLNQLVLTIGQQQDQCGIFTSSGTLTIGNSLSKGEALRRLLVCKELNDDISIDGTYFQVGNMKITGLMLAADAGLNDIARDILHHFARINATDLDGSTALMFAAASGNINLQNILIDLDAVVNRKNLKGQTALLLAAINGHQTTVANLMKKGANADLKDNEGRPALDYLSIKGDVGMVRILAANGANVNIQEPHGWTPLMRATYRGYTEMEAVLLANGADPNIRDNKGHTAESWRRNSFNNLLLNKLNLLNKLLQQLRW